MDLWFGDSWPVGNEIGPIHATYDKGIFPNVNGTDNPLMAFSTLVSKHRKQPFINFAKDAASLDYALYQLINFCNTCTDLISSESLTAFLCATAQIRGFGFDHILKKEYHYFDNNRKSSTPIYDSLMTINAFYSICKMYNIKCVIIPIFCEILIPDELNHIILFDDSILTKTSLVEHTFGEKLIDDKLYERPDCSENEIYKHISSKEWIKPHRMHPNIIGHRKLAYKLIELLENSGGNI